MINIQVRQPKKKSYQLKSPRKTKQQKQFIEYLKTTGLSYRNVFDEKKIASLAEQRVKQALTFCDLHHGPVDWYLTERKDDIRVHRYWSPHDDETNIYFRVACKVKASFENIVAMLFPSTTFQYSKNEKQLFPDLIDAAVLRSTVPVMLFDEDDTVNSRPSIASYASSQSRQTNREKTQIFPRTSIKWFGTKFAGRFTFPGDFCFVEHVYMDKLNEASFLRNPVASFSSSSSSSNSSYHTENGRNSSYKHSTYSKRTLRRAIGYMESIDSTALHLPRVTTSTRFRRGIIRFGIVTVIQTEDPSVNDISFVAVMDFHNQYTRRHATRIIESYALRFTRLRDFFYSTLLTPVVLRPKSEWRTSSSCKNCYICTTNFNILRSKHHCRSCGEVVCTQCSKNWTIQVEGHDEIIRRLCTMCSLKARNQIVAKDQQHNDASYQKSFQFNILDNIAISSSASSYSASSEERDINKQWKMSKEKMILYEEPVESNENQNEALLLEAPISFQIKEETFSEVANSEIDEEEVYASRMTIGRAVDEYSYSFSSLVSIDGSKDDIDIDSGAIKSPIKPRGENLEPEVPADVKIASVVATHAETTSCLLHAYGELIVKLGDIPDFILVGYGANHHADDVLEVMKDIAPTIPFCGSLLGNNAAFSETCYQNDGNLIVLWGIYDREGHYTVCGVDGLKTTPNACEENRKEIYQDARQTIQRGFYELGLGKRQEPDFIWLFSSFDSVMLLDILKDYVTPCCPILGNAMKEHSKSPMNSKINPIHICSEGPVHSITNGFVMAICCPSVVVSHAFFHAYPLTQNKEKKELRRQENAQSNQIHPTSFISNHPSIEITHTYENIIETIDGKNAWDTLNKITIGALEERALLGKQILYQILGRIHGYDCMGKPYYEIIPIRYKTVSRDRIRRTRLIETDSTVVKGEQLVAFNSRKTDFYASFGKTFRGSFTSHMNHKCNFSMYDVQGCLFSISKNYLKAFEESFFNEKHIENESKQHGFEDLFIKPFASMLNDPSFLSFFSHMEYGSFDLEQHSISAHGMCTGLIFSNQKKQSYGLSCSL